MAQLEGEVQLRAQPCARALDGGAAGLARREEGLVGGREEGLVAAGRRPAPLEGLGEGLGLGSCIMTTPSRPAACSGASAAW